jgi:hypothetical protein
MTTEADFGAFTAVQSRVLGERITVAIADEVFAVATEPSLGDTFDLMDAPEPTPENEAQAVRALSRFLERVIVPEERARYQALLYRLPRGQGSAILTATAVELVERLTGFPSAPLASSSGTRRATGSRTKPATAGAKGSKAARRTAPTRSSTTPS